LDSGIIPALHLSGLILDSDYLILQMINGSLKSHHLIRWKYISALAKPFNHAGLPCYQIIFKLMIKDMP
jgi:hypothetical protein